VRQTLAQAAFLLYYMRTAAHASRHLLNSYLRSAAERLYYVCMAKNKAAVQLGRKGGTATAKKLTAEERKKSASKAARARWAKQKKEAKHGS
jgi:hypothetical protein